MRLAAPDPDALRARLAHGDRAPEIHLFDEIDSTNRVGRERALAGAPDGTLVLAEAQLGGRGREGRTWFSPPGLGLWMTIVRRVPVPAGRGGLVPLAVGIAVCEALERTHPVAVSLKWPNDVMIADRKLGGILVESSTARDVVTWLVIGVGLNLVAADGDFPDDLRGQAVSLAGAGVRNVDRTGLVVALHGAIMAWTDRLVDEDGTRVIDAFARRDRLRDRRVAVTTSPAGTREGIARGIEPDGALRVEDTSGVRSVRSGTIRVL